jgi:hypothetical protein
VSVQRLLAAGLLAAALVGCGGSSGTRESERNTEDDEPGRPPPEAKLELPPFPAESDLVQFYPGPSVGGHRYYIDATHLIVGQDRIVRYAVVMHTSGGATNVTYEGIRCQSSEQRLYALGYPGKGWIEAKRSEWAPIRRGRINEYQSFLSAEYFCPYGAVPSDKQSIVNLLRQGLSAPSLHRGDR